MSNSCSELSLSRFWNLRFQSSNFCGVSRPERDVGLVFDSVQRMEYWILADKYDARWHAQHTKNNQLILGRLDFPQAGYRHLPLRMAKKRSMANRANEMHHRTAERRDGTGSVPSGRRTHCCKNGPHSRYAAEP